MKYLELINANIHYVYIGLIIILFIYLINLLINLNHFTKHLSQAINSINKLQKTSVKTIDSYKERINHIIKTFKTTFLLIFFISFARKDYKQSGKKSVVRSTFNASKASFAIKQLR